MAKIEVAKDRCKGCGLCIMNCPKKIIKIGSTMNPKGYFIAEQIDESKCTGCALCAVMCPDMAITVYK
ncbi:MAG: 4Fe-4S binding protein [Eubacteriaceae bacterium]|nr:4Fe-4S binding protein [Eubacteriaceae bacterium]